MIRDDVLRPREPERREAGEHAALVGDLGRQDHVEGRDPVGGDEQQALVVEGVELAHLAAARDGSRPQAWTCSTAERAKPVEDDVDMACVGAEVEDGIEVDAAGDLGVGPHELREVQALVPGAHRVTLHEPVRVVAREAGFDEREQQTLAEVQPMARVEVLAHPLGSDDEAFDAARRTGRACSRRRGTRPAARSARRRSGRCPARARARRSRARRPRSPRTTRASPQIRSEMIGFRLCGIDDDPF